MDRIANVVTVNIKAAQYLLEGRTDPRDNPRLRHPPPARWLDLGRYCNCAIRLPLSPLKVCERFRGDARPSLNCGRMNVDNVPPDRERDGFRVPMGRLLD
jgi:hypothetical protein